MAELQLKEGAVPLVHEEKGPDPLGDGLPQHGLSLDADTGDTVNGNKSSIIDTESSGHFSGEVNVAGESIQLMRKPGLLVPSFFLAAGCLMKARSFSSMLKNVEMA